MFQRFKHQDTSKSEYNQTTQDQRQSSNYVHKKDQSKLPTNLKVNDAIVKPPIKKDSNQNIPRQYNLNNVMTSENKEQNNLSVLEQITIDNCLS